MGMEFLLIKIKLFCKECGEIINYKDKENKFFKMVLHTQDNLKILKSKVRENFFSIMDNFIKVNGNKVNLMDMELIYGKTEIIIQDNGKIIK